MNYPYVFEAKTRKFEIAGGGSQFTVAYAHTDENTQESGCT